MRISEVGRFAAASSQKEKGRQHNHFRYTIYNDACIKEGACEIKE